MKIPFLSHGHDEGSGKEDLQSVMQRIDAAFYDSAHLPYRGWHDDQSALENYRPMIQQVRAEFEEFLAHVIDRKLSGTAIQIGLGISGGSHFALRQVFSKVITIDCDPANIRRFKSFFSAGRGDIIIEGLSTDSRVMKKVRQMADGADLLFIDGGHIFNEVKADWENYAKLVRPGGMVCFHDHVPRPARYHELQIDIFLAWLEHQPFRPKRIVRIGNTLGIAYYVVNDPS